MLRFGQVETGLKPVCTLGHIAKKTCPHENGDTNIQSLKKAALDYNIIYIIRRYKFGEVRYSPFS